MGLFSSLFSSTSVSDRISAGRKKADQCMADAVHAASMDNARRAKELLQEAWATHMKVLQLKADNCGISDPQKKAEYIEREKQFIVGEMARCKHAVETILD